MKKKKRSLTKEQRDALLRSLSTTPSDSVLAGSNISTVSDHPSPQRVTHNTPSLTTTAELKRIAIVFSIIVIILIGMIFIDHTTPYLGKAGALITHRFGL